MFASLRSFLQSDAPSRAHAAAALRTLFVLAFGGQAALAALSWGVLALIISPEPGPSLTAQVLVVMGALLLPLTLLLSYLGNRAHEAQIGALAAALLEGILLAAPLWFALFVWLIGSPLRYTALLLGLGALYYALGLLLVTRHAQQATVLRAKTPTTTKSVTKSVR